MIYDISRPLTPRSAVFPGDTPVSIMQVLRLRDGDSCNVSSITLSLHAGTHVDAPRHYADDGPGIDRVPLEVLIGPARVITLTGSPAIDLAFLTALSLDGVARLLVHTRASDVPDDRFDETFAHVTPDAAAWLGARGLRLFGTDAPSVDPASSVELPAHHAFLEHDTIIVENLRLQGVLDGDYELLVLPLSVVDGDAAPARAVLRAAKPLEA